MELKGKTVLVTGASRGIGLCIARRLCAEGLAVGLIADKAGELEQSVEELLATGAKVAAEVGNISEPVEVEKMVGSLQATLGAFDFLINNAGTLSLVCPVWESDPGLWMRDIRVNLMGSFLVTRSVLPGMIERRRGTIINIVGGGISDPHPYCTSYASSKCGLMRFTEGLAAEAQPHGVKVFALAPPTVLTDMTRFIMKSPGGQKYRKRFVDRLAAGDTQPAEMVAELAWKLLGGHADALTGRLFHVGGHFEQMLARQEEILEKDLMTLRIRSL